MTFEVRSLMPRRNVDRPVPPPIAAILGPLPLSRPPFDTPLFAKILFTHLAVIMTSSFDWRIPATTCGSALPRVAFMTWPTRNRTAVFLAAQVVSHRAGVGLDHFVSDGIEFGCITDLLQSLLFDYLVRIGATPVHLAKYLLCPRRYSIRVAQNAQRGPPDSRV